MKKSALHALILTCLFEVAVCGWIRIYRKAKNWGDARDHCGHRNKVLLPIRNQEEYDGLRSKISKEDSRKWWIGLYKDEDGMWKWPGGQNASFFNWSEEQPSEDERCVVQHETGWLKENCEHKFYFACFDIKLVLVKEKKTWEEAMEQCHTQHGDLVSLNSQTAMSAALRTIKGAQTDHVWTGLRYLADSWLWVNGDKGKYQDWSTGDPPQCSARTHRCGALSLTGGYLESWDCADKLNFVCFEKED